MSSDPEVKKCKTIHVSLNNHWSAYKIYAIAYNINTWFYSKD